MSVKSGNGSDIMSKNPRHRRELKRRRRAGFSKKRSKSLSGIFTTASKRRAQAKSPAEKQEPVSGSGIIKHFLITIDGSIDVDAVGDYFGLSKGQLAETLGLQPETLQRFSRAYAPKTQTRLREMLEIVGRVTDWAGGPNQAMAWYRAEPIPAFGDRTAEFLVQDEKAWAVRKHLDRVALGGFA
jgi:uncharacterized protein (DUF2384 family)